MTKFTFNDAIHYKRNMLGKQIPILYNEIVKQIKKDIDKGERRTEYPIPRETFNILADLFQKDGYKTEKILDEISDKNCKIVIELP